MFSAPNTSGEELDNCLCPSPWLCSPSLVLSLHCLSAFDLGSTPELCGRVAPQAGPSNSQGSPHTVQGKGLGHQQQLPSWCRGTCCGPRIPLKQLSLCHTTASTHWQNRTLQAGGKEGGEGEEPLRYPAADLAAQDPPHLAQPTLPPHTHPASDSEVPQAQAALLEAASTPLREIP